MAASNDNGNIFFEQFEGRSGCLLKCYKSSESCKEESGSRLRTK